MFLIFSSGKIFKISLNFALWICTRSLKFSSLLLEKFIASLCLALGMSDVIQSFQGSISIDTMFIDEGFGSLDEESLHKSIEALVSLQQTGRMIGVISHVEELKTMFPAMLEVKKTKEGYSKAKFVLK